MARVLRNRNYPPKKEEPRNIVERIRAYGREYVPYPVGQHFILKKDRNDVHRRGMEYRVIENILAGDRHFYRIECVDTKHRVIVPAPDMHEWFSCSTRQSDIRQPAKRLTMSSDRRLML